MRILIAATLGLFCLTILAGCGNGMASVSGTVTYDGAPLETGTISFHPQEKGPMGYGTIQSDGTFEVKTGSQEGLPPGTYKATVSATGPMPEPTEEDPEPIGESLIPERYGSVTTSNFEFEIGSSGDDLTITLTSDEP